MIRYYNQGRGLHLHSIQAYQNYCSIFSSAKLNVVHSIFGGKWNPSPQMRNTCSNPILVKWSVLLRVPIIDVPEGGRKGWLQGRLWNWVNCGFSAGYAGVLQAARESRTQAYCLGIKLFLGQTDQHSYLDSVLLWGVVSYAKVSNFQTYQFKGWWSKFQAVSAKCSMGNGHRPWHIDFMQLTFIKTSWFQPSDIAMHTRFAVTDIVFRE